MSVGFSAVHWNRAKIIYDAILIVAVLTFIVGFMAIGVIRKPPKDAAAWIDLRIHAFGACAFAMLTVILSIGPLARLDARCLPLLYNRRHFGVLAFLVALLHALFVVEWFSAQSSLADLAAQFTTWNDYAKFIGFPYKTLGLVALLIMLLMAATSHDYWLAFLTPPVWKAMHMLIYLAYGLATLHVALGALQNDRSPLTAVLFGGGFALVAALHLAAAMRERRGDAAAAAMRDGWIAVGPPESIPDKAARIVKTATGERIAVFRDGDQIGALTNLCAHQNGPLGEGRIIDGCVTCPWHGYQYRLHDGCAPAPFTEKLATYPIRLRAGIVEVDPRPLPPGTPASIRI